MRPCRYFLTLLLFFACSIAYCQQDLDFQINATLLTGKKVLKVKRDFNDPFAWVLTSNNGVYRVNSTTLAIDDYTAKFSAYDNLHLVDIAGLNQDEVFIASNSTTVIEYKKGIIKTIGPADGLVDPVNSIGVNFSGPIVIGSLVIGTTKGRGILDPTTGELAYFNNSNQTDIKIFEATYRTFIYKENSYDLDDPRLYPILISGYQIAQEAYIYRVNESGNNVTTVYATLQFLISNPGYGSDIFWGNEKGMFQEALQNNHPDPPFGHYLDNISVNKITAIYGLTSLGNPYTNNPLYTLTKENLLIGTAKGLYFSNSTYGNFNGSSLHSFSLFHYDQLGNVNINDICVSGTASNYLDTPTGCEGGIWLASDNGLYLIKPDYAKYFDPKQILKAASFNIPNGDNLSETNICSGSSIQLVLNQNDIQNNAIQWYKDGRAITGATGATLTVRAAGDYNAAIYASCENLHVESNHLKVQVMSAPVFSFNYPDKIKNCTGDPVTLKTEDNPAYTYRWYTNGVLNGETSSSFAVTQTGKYKVEVSGCTNSWVPSKEIEVDLVQLPMPTIAADKTSYCAGESAILTVDAPADPGYVINWFKGGVKLAADKNKTSITTTDNGKYTVTLNSIATTCANTSAQQEVTFAPAPIFTFNYPDELKICDGSPVTLKAGGSAAYQYRWYRDGALTGDVTPSVAITQTGKYKVEVSACTNSWVPSKEIDVELVQLPVPAIAADKTKYCAGDNAILTVDAPTDPAYEINWFKDGNKIAADENKTSITTTDNGKYTVTISSSVATCASTSAQQEVTFTPAPVFTFNYPNELRLCDGSPVTLKAQGSAAYQYRWYKDGTLTGDVTPSLVITQTGKYKVEVSSCDGSWVPSTEVQVDFVSLPAPVIITDKPSFCIGDNATLSVGVPAASGYAINWYKNNVLLPSSVNQTSITTTEAGDYTVSVVNKQANSDGTICSQTSAIQSIIFNPPPIVSIQKIIKTTLCDGQPVDLKVSYDNGTVNWSNGGTGDQITVSTSGTYRATVTTAAGCSVDASVDVQFFQSPALSIANGGLCTASHKTVTLTAPSGLKSYQWNGQTGGETFLADHAQTVTLTVTDLNGCQATQEIQVTDDCPDVKIPNTFTPNGDGINDTWDIIGLMYDPTAVVKIFTRYGQEIYESKGYGKPWSGDYRGKKLAAGVYYYVITTKKNGKQSFSGPVTIIY